MKKDWTDRLPLFDSALGNVFQRCFLECISLNWLHPRKRDVAFKTQRKKQSSESELMQLYACDVSLQSIPLHLSVDYYSPMWDTCEKRKSTRLGHSCRIYRPRGLVLLMWKAFNAVLSCLRGFTTHRSATLSWTTFIEEEIALFVLLIT